MQSDLVDIFANAGLRLTKQRIDIFKTLKGADTPLSIVQIAAACPAVDKVSAYRTMRLFAELGIATTVTRGWKQSYELSAPFAPHHHHMVCSNCGDVIELKSEKIEALVREVSSTHGFTPSSHHFEVSGLCRQCID